MIYWLMMGVWIFGFELFLHTLYLRAVSVALLVASVVALIWGHHVASQVAVLVLVIGSAWVYLDKQIRSQEISQLIENQENNDNLLKEIMQSEVLPDESKTVMNQFGNFRQPEQWQQIQKND